MNTVLNLADLIRERSFYSEFQPLWKTENDTIFAFEAFIRTAQKINPETIFDFGRENGLLYEFDTASISNAIKEFPKVYLRKYLLFVNIFPSTMVHSDFPMFIKRLLYNYPEIKGRIVLEINEAPCEAKYWEHELFVEHLSLLKSMNFKIAFDDLPLNETPINLIQKYRPHFVKLDREYSKELSKSLDKQENISFLLAFSKQNMIVVLEGIETKEDLITANELGVPLLQGYYISKPHRL